MMISEYPYSFLPFPEISRRLREKYQISNLYLRPFGKTSADLDIDFNLNPIINLITHLLYNSATDIDGNHPPIQFVWDLPVNSRIKCLIYISLINTEEPFEIKLKCNNDECLENFGFFITQKFINTAFFNDPEKEFVEIEFQKFKTKFRIPTGTDQLKWLQKSYKNKIELQSEIISSLIAENSVNDKKIQFNVIQKSLEKISSIMDKFNPFINPVIEVICPFCQNVGKYHIDFQCIALETMKLKQETLFKIIHILASKYHWDEHFILSLPIWRRNKYITLIRNGDDFN